MLIIFVGVLDLNSMPNSRIRLNQCLPLSAAGEDGGIALTRKLVPKGSFMVSPRLAHNPKKAYFYVGVGL